MYSQGSIEAMVTAVGADGRGVVPDAAAARTLPVLLIRIGRVERRAVFPAAVRAEGGFVGILLPAAQPLDQRLSEA